MRWPAGRSMFGVVGLVLVVTAACGVIETGASTPLDPPSTTTTVSSLGGDGLPVRVPGEDYGPGGALMTGTLELESNGCWTIDLGDRSRLVVFPAGFDQPTDDGSVMVSPEGDRYADGDPVDAEGLIVGPGSLPGGPDGFWASYVGFCAGEDQVEVVVLNTIAEAFDPTGLSDLELREMLEIADLSVSWDCGFGFQLSTEDQSVAIRIFPTDMDLTPPSGLPDPAWEANAVIGKYLQVNNCDDVVEGWEPMPQIVAVWPVTAGSLSFEIPSESGCGLVDSVTARLEGIVVTTPSGEVELGDLVAVNEAFGCFAG